MSIGVSPVSRRLRGLKSNDHLVLSRVFLLAQELKFHEARHGGHSWSVFCNEQFLKVLCPAWQHIERHVALNHRQSRFQLRWNRSAWSNPDLPFREGYALVCDYGYGSQFDHQAVVRRDELFELSRADLPEPLETSDFVAAQPFGGRPVGWVGDLCQRAMVDYRSSFPRFPEVL